MWKLTSTFNCTGTGLPLYLAGLNLYCFTASMAFSSSPMPTPRTRCTFSGLPFWSTTRFTSTMPMNFALRASSLNSGSTFQINSGSDTPPPIFINPPPYPPPVPGPSPDPLPLPSPEPRPLPIEFPSSGEFGSPRLGILLFAIFRLVCTSMVGSGMRIFGRWRLGRRDLDLRKLRQLPLAHRSRPTLPAPSAHRVLRLRHLRRSRQLDQQQLRMSRKRDMRLYRPEQ